ncbi:phage tail tape measure protein [Microbacterium esteraromaticum]|uniref:phage tail tape measure protein n=1 Tax=Microbacterium esteraromaticum TaxID=57043 RepID=UPI0030B736A3
MFDAGALIFKLQTVGAQVFQQDQASAEKAVEKTGKAAATSATQIDKLGTSTDETGKKAKSSKAPLEDQAKSTKKVGEESEQASKKQTKQTQSTEQQISAAKELSRVMLLSGAAVAAMITLSVAKNTEFEQGMSNVRAATMATASEQRALGEAALEAGADTAYSASEAAAAEEELAKAGQNVADIVGGSLNASLALAAAGQLQVARSAEIMATAMTQFEIPADRAAHVSDVLAAGAGKAQGSVDDLALALSYVGPLANQAGWSIDETSGAISYFASQGILGEKAGTSLRGVLAALQSPSTVAAKTMAQYGLSIYDANGNMLSAAQIAGNLQQAFGSLTAEERNAAMGRIFGNESLLAANLLYAGGAEKVAEWTDAVNDTGYAARQAAMRQDNLAGDIEKLGGAFDTALIRTGTHANDVLRGMVQGLTELVDLYGEAPEPIQATATVIGVAAAAMLIFGGGAVGARAKFIELKATLDATNASMGRTAIVGGAAGIALTGVIAVDGLLMAAQAEARQKAESYADTLEAGTNRITRATRELAKENLSQKGQYFWWETSSAYDSAERLGISLDLVTDAATGNIEALRELDKQLASARPEDLEANTRAGKDALEAYESQVRNVTDAVAGEAGSIERATEIAKQKQRVDAGSVETAENVTEAYIAEADSVEDLNAELQDLIDRINDANGVGQDAITANAKWQEALAGLDEQVEKTGTSLKQSTVEGSANAAALADVAAAAQDAAKAQFEQDQTTMSADEATQKYLDTLAAQRDAFIDSAVQAGYNRDEVVKLADEIFKLPSEKEIAIIADAARAQRVVDGFLTMNDGKRVRVFVDAVTGQQSWKVGGKTVSGTDYADGAVVRFNADGNVYRSEHHVAQIARAGDWRVWAEPETGGETYVPHAPSKRARSEAIMAETARIFGGEYIPAGARRFANGDVVTGSTAPVNVNVVVSPKGGINLLDYVDIRVEQKQSELDDSIRGV